MSRSSRHKHKYEKGTEVFEDQRNGGTAARTRPFSFDEIMLRRKNKKEFGNVEDPPGGAVSIPGKGTSEKASVREESNRHRHRHNDFINSSGKRISDESVKVISRRKEDDTSIKEDKPMKGEEKGSRDSERKAKATLNTNNSGDKAKGGKKYRRGDDKRKDELSSDDSGNDYEKRDSKVSLSKDRHVDGYRGKVEVIGKRKKENDDDEHTRDWNAGKKHDSQKWHDSEFSERKEKKEASHSRHEDSRSKRRRSRSREHDKEKNRRPLSPSREKKEKKEATKSRHEDARSKRRRSRSREHDKDKSKRSSSPSARGHKRTSDAREHGELTSHSSKDRSGRFNSDIDRKRVQINGSSNQSRRHGVSASRLGGYSPRKRRSDAAVKTPSPASRSPEKKNAGWDFPPDKPESKYPGSILSNLESSNQSVLASEHELSSVVIVPSSTPKPILGAVSTTPSSKINSSMDSIQLTQATRPKRRLYVENLPSSASEEAVMEWLNSYLLSSGVNHIQGTNPCISCIVHKEKGQALVEFLTPEDASAALLFDGRTFSGSILKIRRPKDFAEVTSEDMVSVTRAWMSIQANEELPKSCSQKNSKGFALAITTDLTPACSKPYISLSRRLFSKLCHIAISFIKTGVPDKSVAAVDTIKDVVEDSPHKIFVGGIPKVISSEMLMEIASSFGPLKAYHFETNFDLIGSCAFLEYVDQSVTSKACAGLNGMRLGGQVLTVTQAIPDASSVENFGSRPFYGIPDNARPLLEKPTQVLKLINVLDPNSLSSLSGPELEEILEDIRLECARFGTVKSINTVKFTKRSTSSDVCEEDDCDDKNREREGMVLETGNFGRFDESSLSLANEELEEVKEPVNVKSSQDDEVVDRSCLPRCTKEPEEELNKAVEDNYTVHEDKLVKDEICDSEALDDSVVDQQTMQDDSTSYPSNPIEEQLDCQDNKLTEFIIKTEDNEMDNESLVKVEWKPEDGNGKLENKSDFHCVRTELDSIENGFHKNRHESEMKDVFEPGCVLVEYRRAEASCIAAHSLHGRLFDNRIVTVGYVAHDLYCARFPK